MVGSVLPAALCGCVCSRVRLRGRKAGLLSILILQMFPSFPTSIAVYMLFLNFGLLDSLTGLALVSIAAALPYNIWLTKGCTDSLPASLDEAAAIEAAGAVVPAVPITILYIVLQRYLVTGAAAGAEKG